MEFPYYTPKPFKTAPLWMFNGGPKYKATQLRQYELNQFQIVGEGIQVVGRLANGEQLTSNFLVLPAHIVKELNAKYFIMDKSDYELFRRSNPQDQLSRMLLYQRATSLTEFAKIHPKRLYIRSFPSPNWYSDDRYVFTDDVLEVIPIALGQQGNPISDFDARIAKLREHYENEARFEYGTISIEEFNRVLEYFDVNKSLITLVPCFIHKVSMDKQLKTGTSYVFTLGRDGTEVYHSSQVALWLLQETFSCLCAIEEDEECENAEEHANTSSKTCFSSYMISLEEPNIRIAEVVPHHFMTREDPYGEIEGDRVLENCYRLRRKRNNPSVSSCFEGLDGMDEIKGEIFLAVAEAYLGETKFNINPKAMIPVWKARIYMLIEFIQYLYSLFGCGSMMANCFYDALTYMAPHITCFTSYQQFLKKELISMHQADLLMDTRHFKMNVVLHTEQLFDHAKCKKGCMVSVLCLCPCRNHWIKNNKTCVVCNDTLDFFQGVPPEIGPSPPHVFDIQKN